MTTSSRQRSTYRATWIGLSLAHERRCLLSMSTVWVHFLLFFIVSSATAGGQAMSGHQPIGGDTYEAVINRLFSGHPPLTPDTRFQLTFRILPPFAPEAEVSISYTTNQKAAILLTVPSKAVRGTLDEYASTGAPRDLETLISLVQARTETLEVKGELVGGWLRSFWSAVAGFANNRPRLALKGDETGEVEVTLDATVYQVFYSDSESQLKFSVLGPDPHWSGNPRKLDPLIKWMLEVRQNVEALRIQRTK